MLVQECTCALSETGGMLSGLAGISHRGGFLSLTVVMTFSVFKNVIEDCK